MQRLYDIHSEGKLSELEEKNDTIIIIANQNDSIMNARVPNIV